MTSYDQYTDEIRTTIYAFNKIIRLFAFKVQSNTCDCWGWMKSTIYTSSHRERSFWQPPSIPFREAIRPSGDTRTSSWGAPERWRWGRSSEERERHIYNSVKNAMYEFEEALPDYRYGSRLTISVKLKIRRMDTWEYFWMLWVSHYPLRDYGTYGVNE